MQQLKALTENFHSSEIEWRLGRKMGGSHQALAYVDARAIQKRLDDVVGADNWYDDYQPCQSGILCRLSIRFDNLGFITKCNGSPETNIEAFKGGLSKAFVRVASNWGIGRYLYGLKGYMAIPTQGGKYWAKDLGAWNPPGLPFWALSRAEQVEVTIIERMNALLKTGLELSAIKTCIQEDLGLTFNSSKELLSSDIETLIKVDEYLGELCGKNIR